MLAGLILILSGVLIAIYPPLLALVVAALLITTGLLTLVIAYQNRKIPEPFRNPVIKVFFQL